MDPQGDFKTPISMHFFIDVNSYHYNLLEILPFHVLWFGTQMGIWHNCHQNYIDLLINYN